MNIEDGINIITMPLKFAWSELESPDYNKGTQYEKGPGKGTYYVSALLDPTETDSTFKVDGKVHTGGQKAFIDFMAEMDQASYAANTEGMTPAKAKAMRINEAAKPSTSEKSEGMYVMRASMTETTKSGKNVKPVLADATGAPCSHPAGSVMRGRCEVLLFPALISGASNVIKYLKAVQILETGGGSSEAGSGFEPDEGYKAEHAAGSSFVDETVDNGL